MQVFTPVVRTIFNCLNSVSYTHNLVIDFFHCSNFNLFAVKMRFVNLFPISRIDKDEINHVSHDTTCHMKTPKLPLLMLICNSSIQLSSPRCQLSQMTREYGGMLKWKLLLQYASRKPICMKKVIKTNRHYQR